MPGQCVQVTNQEMIPSLDSIGSAMNAARSPVHILSSHSRCRGRPSDVGMKATVRCFRADFRSWVKCGTKPQIRHVEMSLPGLGI